MARAADPLVRRWTQLEVGYLPDCERTTSGRMLPVMPRRVFFRSIPSTFIRHAVFAGALAVYVAALAACTRVETRGAPPSAPQVTAAAAVARPVTEFDEFTGRLQAVQSVAVRPRVSGLISSVTFTEGSLVHQGQLLFQVDDRPFRAEVDRLRAELAQANAASDRAQSEKQRAERLTVDNAISAEERERRAGAAAESTAHAAAVAATLRSAELDLEFTRVVAPIDGRVSRALVTRGNLVSGGQGEATLLTTVVSVDPIYASFDADEQTFLRYGDRARQQSTPGHAAGLPIQMALADEKTFAHAGTLQFMDNQLDPATGTINGRAVFHNPDRRLTPGLFVRLRLPGTATYRGVLVEDRAVGTDLDRRYVLVVGADKKIESRTVTLGPLVDGLRVVRQGLKEGELIVVNGLQRVRPGMPVSAKVVEMGGAL
jgi:multidrug efflux system membrane fusion protein